MLHQAAPVCMGVRRHASLSLGECRRILRLQACLGLPRGRRLRARQRPLLCMRSSLSICKPDVPCFLLGHALLCPVSAAAAAATESAAVVWLSGHTLGIELLATGLLPDFNRKRVCVGALRVWCVSCLLRVAALLLTAGWLATYPGSQASLEGPRRLVGGRCLGTIRLL